MEHNIKTKYNVNDRVYVIDYYYDYCYSYYDKYIVKEIQIVIRDQTTRVSYVVYNEGNTDHIRYVGEAQLFDSYEDCIKYCEKQNEKSVKLPY
jgi:hypothetical protein